MSADAGPAPSPAALSMQVRADLGRHAEAVLARYDEPHRAYHTVEHLREAWAALETLLRAEAVTGERARTARLALWFHDAVYDPRAADNEAASAALARRVLGAAGEPAGVVDDVARLVEATAEHRAAPDDAAAGCLLDADLWILSAPPDRYDRYVAQVRTEYAHVPDSDFAAGRGAILRDLLDRPRLYVTSAARPWESPARANLARELTPHP